MNHKRLKLYFLTLLLLVGCGNLGCISDAQKTNPSWKLQIKNIPKTRVDDEIAASLWREAQRAKGQGQRKNRPQQSILAMIF